MKHRCSLKSKLDSRQYDVGGDARWRQVSLSHTPCHLHTLLVLVMLSLFVSMCIRMNRVKSYPDESSQVVVYWLTVITCLVDYLDVRWWKCFWLYDAYGVGSSLPISLHGCVVCGYSFLRWSSTWLMGADGRSSRGQQGNGDSTA